MKLDANNTETLYENSHDQRENQNYTIATKVNKLVGKNFALGLKINIRFKKPEKRHQWAHTVGKKTTELIQTTY